MRESQNLRNQIIMFSNLIMFFIFTIANLSLARPRLCVYVELDSQTHIAVPFPLKLTFHIPSPHLGKPIKVPIAIGPVQGGAGLVVDHITPDGTKTTQTLDPETWWYSQAETLEMKLLRTERGYVDFTETQFDVWILIGKKFDFSKPGIYHISYAHPWAEPEEDPNSLVFRSNTLTIMPVTEERANQLHKILQDKPELALASYKFKNPPSAIEMPKYKRSVPKIIDEAIKKGARQDEVLFLLGSPDMTEHTTIGMQKTYGWDETWDYETSPAGGYYIHFKNGRVVRKGFHADWSGED